MVTNAGTIANEGRYTNKTTIGAPRMKIQTWSLQSCSASGCCQPRMPILRHLPHRVLRMCEYLPNWRATMNLYYKCNGRCRNVRGQLQTIVAWVTSCLRSQGRSYQHESHRACLFDTRQARAVASIAYPGAGRLSGVQL